MTIFNYKITSEKLFRLLFHVLFWGMLLGWPILNSIGNEEFRRFTIRMLPVSLTYIPLFFLNTEWLIPRFLRKKGIGPYLLSLVVLVLVFIALQMSMRAWILDSGWEHLSRHLFFTSIFVMLVTGVSTGYGFITYLVDQEKARQEEQQERLKSELSFLRSQISPHFIFNILNSIVYLIRSRSELAEPVTIKLSELMRYMLYQSEDAQVPLDKEIGYLENYVELQRIRFGEDVDIQLKIDGDTYSHVIEPMLMIPFVENAFKHGVGMIADPVIDIELKLNSGDLRFRVRNKIAPETSDDKDFSSGIGLRNVRRRLELLYPGTHQLEVTNNDGWFDIYLHLQFPDEGKILKKIAVHEAEMHRR